MVSVKWCAGEIAAVGPTSFEFCVPDGVPLTVLPAVSTVLPGQVIVLHISAVVLHVVDVLLWD